MKNRELSNIFEEMADLLEILGQDPSRINSYRRVGRVISDLAEDIESLWKQGSLAELAGVGKNSVSRIDEYLETGKIGDHQKLLKQVPPVCRHCWRLPGWDRRPLPRSGES